MQFNNMRMIYAFMYNYFLSDLQFLLFFLKYKIKKF